MLLSCGEASGDLYAGALTRALRDLVPDVDVAGLGGPAFAAAGGRVLVDYRGLSVTGFTEIVAKVPRLRAAKRALIDEARRSTPHALVAIDYFGFNARLARDAARLDIPIVYYVSPQVWAWRSGRIKTIRALVRRMLVIFPFEEAIYREAGVPVEFVGHPLVDLAHSGESREAMLQELGMDAAAPVVALLPGSRASELRRILPTLADAARSIVSRMPQVQFVLARAPHLDDRLFEPARGLPRCAIVDGRTDAVLAAADLVLTASGTATVQTALHGTPMVVVYRVSPLEYRLVRPMVKLETFAMVNLIAGRRIVPELIQGEFTAERVAAEAVSLLTDPARAARMRADLAGVRERLGAPGASRRAAQAILDIVGETCDTSS
ncbi:MAG: lipid-A-disaccharide synthase [Vicinamibacterales bacterium]